MQFSAVDLYNGINGRLPELDVPMTLYIIMGVGIVMKYVLWLYCLRLNKAINSDTIGRYVLDYRTLHCCFSSIFLLFFLLAVGVVFTCLIDF
jgi:divalent metal cation (Fe/Co/Zn/Cd) transporter